MSLFYRAQYEHLFPIPLLAFERISALKDTPPEEVLPQVLAECCGKPKPTDAEIQYFLQRIKDESDAAQQKVARVEAAREDQPAEPSKSLGSSFQKFVSGLDSSRILLWACGYDYEKAHHLYTQVDRSIAMQIVDDFIQLQHERNTYLFEASLYGMGGQYKDDTTPSSGVADDEIDLTDMDASSIMQILR